MANINIKEFAVAGIPYGKLFAHEWFIGCDDVVDKKLVKEKIDFYLSKYNDDYKTERLDAIKDVFVNILPNQLFIGWLKSQGKEGGSVKFPRVLKNEKLNQWHTYLQNKNIILDVKN